MKQLLRAVLFLCLFTTPSLVRATLTVSIGSSSSLSGCDSICSVFNATVTGCTGTYSSMWFYTNTTTSTTDSSTLPFYCFNRMGIYDVSVRVRCNATGEIGYATNANYVNVHPSPVINFTTTSPATDTILTCGPRNVCFVNRSNSDTAGCSFSWTWIVSGPDGTHYFHTSSLCYTFSVPGNYNVSLQYFAASCGCFGSAVKTNFIKIQAPATACFTRTDGLTLCTSPGTATFDASCSSGATSYIWHFGDHTTATTTTPTISHTYYSSGIFNDTLFARTSAGCLTMVNHDSDVYIGNFTARIATTPDTVCSGTTVTFADSTYVGGRAFNTSFFLYHGSTHVDSVMNTNPVDFTFRYPAPDSAGAFRITEVATDSLGCNSSTTRNIWVRQSPVISAVSADTLYKCTPTLVESFHSTVAPTSGLTYRWSFGDGATASGTPLTSPTHTYTRDSNYAIRLKVTDVHGCSDSMIRANYIKIGRPTFINTLSADSGCVSATNPLRVGYRIGIIPMFTPFEIDSVSFGDSTASCIGTSCMDSAHLYRVGGTRHIITYWRLPDFLGGCSGTDTTDILLGSVLPDGHVSRYWINGSGSPVTADSVCPNTVVVFNTNCTNCTYTSWEIHADGALYTLEGGTHDFDTTSALYGGGMGFGTGLDYSSIVSMTVNGCTIHDTTHVYTFRPSSGTIVPSTPNCARRDSIRYTIVGSTGATAYRWSFGDGTFATSTATAVVHQYTATPPHTYNVIVIDSGGRANRYCTNTDTISFTTGRPPLTWGITDIYPCIGELDTLHGPVTADGSPYPDYFWFFGDGSPSVHTSLASEGLMDSMVTHRFMTAGTYRDTVIVRNSSGCRDTAAIKTVTVIGPHGGLSVSDTLTCLGSLVTFRDLNTDAGATILLPHDWTFNASPMVPGSSFPSTALRVDGGHGYGTLHSGDTAVAFDARGYYNIILRDTDNHGCTSEDRALVHVVKPYAYFTSPDSSTQVCIGLNVSFTDTNTHCTYSWNYGDGTGWSTPSATAQTTTHAYSSNGTFTVKCAIFSNGTMGFPTGCSDTFTRTAYINVAPLVLSSTNFGDDSLVSCPPLHIVRSADSAANSYMWRVTPPGSTFSGAFMHTNVFANGNYRVTMIGTSPRGCVDSVSYNYVIGGPAGYITLTSDSGCAPLPVRLRYIDTGISSSSSLYIWNTCPHGAFTTATPDTTITYSSAGVFCAPTVTIQSGACAVTIPYNNSVQVFPTPIMSVSHLSPICYGHDTTLVTSGSDSHYFWRPSISDLTTYSSDSSTVVLHPTTSTVYTVTGVTTHGCRDTATSTVSVLTLPSAGTIVGLSNVCISATIALSNAVTGGTWSRALSFASVSGSGVVTGLSTGVDTIIYRVSDATCTNRAIKTVSVDPPPSVDTISGLSDVCSGSSITLSNATFGGIWTMSNTRATVAAGSVTGITAGLDTAIYTITNVCGVAIARKSINVIPSFTPTVVIYNPTDTFCAVAPVTLHANITSGGSSPYITWQKGGVFVDTGFTYTLAPSYGDVIKCILHSNAICRLADSVFDVKTLHITSPFTPYVTIHASRDTIAYAGQIITFTATTTYGGSAPVYQWFLNGVATIGATSNAYSVETYSNDTVFCILQSNLPCITNEYDSSNVVVVHTEKLAVGDLNNGENKLSLFPNPNNSSFQITGTLNVSSSNSEINYEVSNISGEVIFKKKIDATGGKINEAIQLDNNIPDGVYILRINSDLRNEVLHFVIRR